MKKEKYLLELQSYLTGLSICYIIKSPDMFFYDFGFGDESVIFDNYDEGFRNVPTYALHVGCAFEIIWKDGSKNKTLFLDDTPCEMLEPLVEELSKLSIKRIALSDKNDLWLDFDKYWLVFITNEDDDESWRFFSPREEKKHLVASNNSLRKI